MVLNRRLSNLLKNDTDCLWQQVQWKAPERDRGRTHRDESPTPMSRDRSSGGVGYTPARVSLTAWMTDILPLPLPPTPRSTVIWGRKLWSRIASRNTNWVNTKWVHMTCWKKKKKKKAYGSGEHEMSPQDSLQIACGSPEHETSPRDLLQIACGWREHEMSFIWLAVKSLWFTWSWNESTRFDANSLWFTWLRNESTWLVANSIWLTWTRNEFTWLHAN